jgi:CBS domain-containing protein
MTREVVTVRPNTTVGEIADLLLDQKISAVPVIAMNRSAVPRTLHHPASILSALPGSCTITYRDDIPASWDQGQRTKYPLSDCGRFSGDFGFHSTT